VKRQTKNLSLLSEHRLNAYTLAATAAGVGALCLAQPAEARIVYTPADVRIPRNSVYALDLNHDGFPDFWLINSFIFFGSSTTSFVGLSVLPRMPSLDGVVAHQPCEGYGVLCAAALPKGKIIGSQSQSFNPGHAFMVDYGHETKVGYWLPQPMGQVQAYLGLRFYFKGAIHYGWARVKVRSYSRRANFTVTLTGYAYETIPDKPIIAGATKGPDEEAGSLGALAAGAAGR
jgi:hypothetical protein